MEKFHYFLYGKEFTLETDQKPLVSIYKKHMVDISPRVQRLISSIYHRHIEHFFTFLAGNAVFSLISESARRL